MTVTEQATLIGVFDDRAQADRAFGELRRAGFRDEQLGFLVRDSKAEDGEIAGENIVAGAAVGGSLATLWGLAVAAGLLPGIGPVLFGGALASVLASAAAGAATGAAVAGVLTLLTGLGVSEDEARRYERELQAGRILITVRPNGRYDEAAAILQRYGAFTDPRLATPY